MSKTPLLEEVLPLLGEAYREWKKWELEKNTHKEEFFSLANAAIERKGLAIKLVEYPAEDLAAATARALLHNPGWTVDEARRHRVTKGLFEVILRENPALKAFSHEVDGVKYARTIRKGSVMVDDAWLKEENPELYEGVTYELPWGDRVMVPLETIPKELVSLLQKYIYNDKPTVSLAAPKAIKEPE